MSRLNWRAIRAVVHRDLRVVRASKPVVIPMLIVPTILVVVLPLALAISARLGGDAVDLSDIEGLIGVLPPQVAERVAADPAAGLVEVGLVYLLSPMLLIIPIVTATVIAADAIAGERERKTLEGLLLTPLTDRELFAAKLLGAWVPAVAVTAAAGIVYAVVGDLAAAGLVESLLFPNPVWATIVFWVGPALAAVSLGVTVIVSARVKTVQEAFQIAGIIVIPVVALVVVQATGVLALDPVLLAAGGLALWIVAALVLRLGTGSVRRTRLGERL